MVILPLAYLLVGLDYSGDEDSPPRVVSTAEAGLDFENLQIPAVISNGCPIGMLRVRGEYCPIVEEICLKWLDHPKSGGEALRCAEFKFPTRCLSQDRIYKDFCIDKFEFPNREGALPEVGRTFQESEQICQNLGKRLCTSSEWTFACEGEDIRPYPYGDGYHRDEDICNTHYEPMPVGTPQAKWKDYYRGEPSGANSGCVSWIGVHDMTGNVDEFVVNELGHPYRSGLKGGYWTNRVRVRCRPMTTAHNETYTYYQNGFRCCGDSEEIVPNE